VRVQIDEARRDDLAARVDDRRVGGRRERLADACDTTVEHDDVELVEDALFRIEQPTPANVKRNRGSYGRGLGHAARLRARRTGV
jgi:hypothetical protein